MVWENAPIPNPKIIAPVKITHFMVNNLIYIIYFSKSTQN
jgi:hypothetical protein